MGKVLGFPGAGAHAAAVEPLKPAPRSKESLDFEAECFLRYRNYGRSRGHSPSYTDQVLGGVRSFIQYAGALEAVTSADYEGWSAYLAIERKNVPSTIRTKQKYIKKFLDYLNTLGADLQNKAVALFGERIERFATSDNSIVHVTDAAAEKGRIAVPPDELTNLFEALDVAIQDALDNTPREARQFMRDKAMFYLMQETGLRASEVGTIRWSDFAARPAAPECGEFATLVIRSGKAARGSGKRSRTVSIDNPHVAEMMAWYRDSVYPLYGKTSGKSDLVFIGERGRGISAKNTWARFKKALVIAGLDGRGYSPHSLRHTMVTSATIHGSLEFARNKAGHASSATTALYTHIPPEHYEAQTRSIIDAIVAESMRVERPSDANGRSGDESDKSAVARGKSGGAQ